MYSGSVYPWVNKVLKTTNEIFSYDDHAPFLFFSSALFTSSCNIRSLKLELLKLLNRTLETPRLRLEVDNLLPVGLLDGLRDLLLVGGVLNQLALLLDVGAGLVELLLGLLDLGVEVDAALDVEVDRGGRSDGECDAAGGAGSIGGDDVDAGDALAAEGLDGGNLLLDGGGRGGVVCLDNDCDSLVTDIHIVCEKTYF